MERAKHLHGLERDLHEQGYMLDKLRSADRSLYLGPEEASRLVVFLHAAAGTAGKAAGAIDNVLGQLDSDRETSL